MDPTTARAEEIRETTGMAWERACLQAERERDSARSDAMIRAADDFERASALIGGYCTIPSSEYVARALYDEAGYLRYGDLADLGSLDGCQDRYVACTRMSRRREVLNYASAAGIDPGSSALVAALDAIGGTS